MDGQIVDLHQLPSKGIGYPKDIEIYVKPLSIKEQIDMERYGITDAEYFRMLLNGVTIHGDFNKNNLLHSDVQFLDVVRRLFSFDTKDKVNISIGDYEIIRLENMSSFNINDDNSNYKIVCEIVNGIIPIICRNSLNIADCCFSAIMEYSFNVLTCFSVNLFIYFFLIKGP